MSAFFYIVSIVLVSSISLSNSEEVSHPGDGSLLDTNASLITREGGTMRGSQMLLEQLRQKRAGLVQEQNRLYEICLKENRRKSKEESDDWDRRWSEIEDIDKKIDSEIEQRRVPESPAKPIPESRAEFSGDPEIRIVRGEKPSYQKLFGPALRMYGFATNREYFEALHSDRFDQRLTQMRAMSSLFGPDGGYVVPDQTTEFLLNQTVENTVMVSGATNVGMTGNTCKVPAFDDSSHSTGTTFGGLKGYWTQELATMTETTPQFRLLELHAEKLAILTQISNELLADGQSIEAQISAAIPQALAWNLDDAMLNGTGAGMPLGVMNSPSLVTQAKETGQAAQTIVYQNVVKMFSRLHPMCIKNAIWLASSTAIPQLSQMTIGVGTGGAVVQALTDIGGQFRLLTRPVLFTEKLPALGTAGDLLLIDRSQYFVGMRKEMSLEKSIHAGFTKDSSYYRCIIRVDGMPSWNTVFTPKNGSTLSWAVALATRA